MASELCLEAYNELLNWRNANGRGSFLPRSSVPFDEPHIEKILRCSCIRCKKHFSFFSTDAFKRRPVYKDYRNQIHEKYRCLFALLVYIHFPAFIIHFVNHHVHDEEVITHLAAGRMDWSQHSAFTVTSANNVANPSILLELSQKIEDEWTNFLRPRIESVDFKVLSPRLRLPIYSKKMLGSGNSGTVFAFKIYRGYNAMPHTQDIRVFACKQMSSANNAEREALKLVNKLQDPHIVRLLTSFEHFSEGPDARPFNLIFPKATTNLEEYLRNVKHDLAQQDFSNIFAAPIWHQALGLMQALQNMHNNLGDKWAVHLDLKPENILVDRLPTGAHFLITDFGLSNIRDPQRSGSGMPGAGGDEAYAPPERDMSRKYDIWSMGCILLEILSYALEYERGVRKLDIARTQHGNKILAFWEVYESKYQIRQSVSHHMKYLLEITESTENVSPRGSWFVQQILQLIKEMFAIPAHNRPTAKDICTCLHNALQEENWLIQVLPPSSVQALERYLPTAPIAEAIPRAATSVADVTRDKLLKDGWKELAPSESSLLEGIVARSHWSPTQEDERVGVSLWQKRDSTNTDLMLVIAFNRSGRTEPLHIIRKTMNLVPAYALRGRHKNPRTFAGIRLQHQGATISAFTFDLDGDLHDLRILQGRLMQQEVCHSIEVSRVIIERPKVSWLGRRLSKKVHEEPLLDDANGLTIQLWRASDHDFGECRVVIFEQGSPEPKIWIMRFSDSLGFESRARSDSPEILSSYLNKNAAQVFFSHFDTEEGQRQPSFPLDPDLFNKRARENQDEFQAIHLYFHDATKRNEFLARYRIMKQQWEHDMGVRR